MENIITGAVSSLGIAGTGYLFLWIFMQRYFKLMDAMTEHLNALTVESRSLSSRVDCLQSTHESSRVLQQEICRQHTAKIDSMDKLLTETYRVLTEFVAENRKIPFGKIAISKKYLTTEQVDEILREQTDLPRRH